MSVLFGQLISRLMLASSPSERVGKRGISMSDYCSHEATRVSDS